MSLSSREHPITEQSSEALPTPQYSFHTNSETITHDEFSRTNTKVAKYADEIIKGVVQPGVRLQEELKKLAKLKGKKLTDKTIASFVKEISYEEFLSCIIKTKESSYIAAENETAFKDWNQQEVDILANVSMVVKCKRLDNGRWKSSATDKRDEKDILLGFVAGLILKPHSPDYKKVVKHGQLDADAYKAELKSRLLPALLAMNNQSQNPPGLFVTIPGLGAGQFAGEFQSTKPSIGSLIGEAIKEIVDTHRMQLSNIKGIYYDGLSSEDAEYTFKADATTVMMRHRKEDLPQLSDPEEFRADFKGCEMASLVAADPVAWPGNDLLGTYTKLNDGKEVFRSGSRNTDEGAKAGATTVMEVMTGVKGSYSERVIGETPRYNPPDGSRSWGQVIKANNHQLNTSSMTSYDKKGVPNRLQTSPTVDAKADTKKSRGIGGWLKNRVGEFVEYAKHNPVKAALFGGLIVLGVAGFIAGTILTGGALAAGAGVVGATAVGVGAFFGGGFGAAVAVSGAIAVVGGIAAVAGVATMNHDMRDDMEKRGYGKLREQQAMGNPLDITNLDAGKNTGETLQSGMGPVAGPVVSSTDTPIQHLNYLELRRKLEERRSENERLEQEAAQLRGQVASRHTDASATSTLTASPRLPDRPIIPQGVPPTQRSPLPPPPVHPELSRQRNLCASQIERTTKAIALVTKIMNKEEYVEMGEALGGKVQELKQIYDYLSGLKGRLDSANTPLKAEAVAEANKHMSRYHEILGECKEIVYAVENKARSASLNSGDREDNVQSHRFGRG